MHQPLFDQRRLAPGGPARIRVRRVGVGWGWGWAPQPSPPCVCPFRPHPHLCHLPPPLCPPATRAPPRATCWSGAASRANTFWSETRWSRELSGPGAGCSEQRRRGGGVGGRSRGTSRKATRQQPPLCFPACSRLALWLVCGQHRGECRKALAARPRPAHDARTLPAPAPAACCCWSTPPSRPCSWTLPAPRGWQRQRCGAGRATAECGGALFQGSLQVCGGAGPHMTPPARRWPDGPARGQLTVAGPRRPPASLPCPPPADPLHPGVHQAGQEEEGGACGGGQHCGV